MKFQNLLLLLPVLDEDTAWVSVKSLCTFSQQKQANCLLHPTTVQRLVEQLAVKETLQDTETSTCKL